MNSPAGAEGVRRSEAVRIWLLGGFRVSVGSRTIEESHWRLRKAAALVKLLAMAPGHRLHREQAMDLLWSGSGRRAASNSLRKTLHAARRTLDPDVGSHYLASEDESLVLCPDSPLWVDVEAFEQAASTARRSRKPTAHEAALELYSGELLPADRYEEWAQEHSQRLREIRLSLHLGLARIYEERAEYESAAEALRGVLSEQSTREEAHAALMRLYALMGSKGEALAQYRQLEEALQEALGTEPSASSRALREEITSGRFPPNYARFLGFPLEEPPGVGKHNLPAPRTSFVGREREMIEVKRALAMTRLLTLTGAGGSGKTRLALEVGRDLVRAYPDGVWLVELAPLSEDDLISQAVGGALGVQEQPGHPLIDTLVETLRAKELLLVVDNCEHLADSVATLLDTLLDTCPRLRVLATSREALNVPSEVRWIVPTLSVPDPQGLISVRELEGSEAVRLFADRSKQRDPAFVLTPHNTQAVAEICSRLNGVPLAIELASARVGMLSVEQISVRLDDSLKLLTEGHRIASPRQQTFRGAMNWSYDLLSEPEQRLFGRLAVFAGGWTLEEAEAVGTGDGIEESEVLELLSGLVNKSLVIAEMRTQGAAARYRMLEPIRQYAWEKLEESGEADEVHGLHAAFILALGEEAKSKWKGPEETTWLDRLESEHDNLRAALSWALQDENPELGLQLAEASWWFWDTRGHFNEGVRWLEEALAKGGDAAPRARAGALNGLGELLRTQGHLERAEACSEEALVLCEELAYPEGVADALAQLGLIAEFRNDAARATSLLEKSLAVAQQSGYQKAIPGVLIGLAWIACDGGDIERAQQMWGEVLEMAREQVDHSQVSCTLFFMGYTELARGNQQRAATLLEESLAMSRRQGEKWIVAGCLGSLGLAATMRGDPTSAKTLIKQGLAINLELGVTWDIAENLDGLAEAAGTLGEYVRAARLWGTAEALREAAGHPWSPTERLLHEPQLIAARTRLDEKTWEAAFAEGKAMTFEGAVEYAVSEVDSAAALTSQVSDESMDHTQQPALTRREEEVAVLVAQGLTNRQIAKELSISEHTAATHVRKILKKLGLQSRSQIASR